MILPLDYFSRPATVLAQELLGKTICRRVGNTVIRSTIVETECYFGEEDTACHAHKGKTSRTATMYRQGGVSYVYLCYGMHAMLNLVTGEEGHPEAVLIRGVTDAIGPGRTTKFLQISTEDNGIPLTPDSGLWLEWDGTPTPEFTALPRVGIDYADKADRERKWRFLIKSNKA